MLLILKVAFNSFGLAGSFTFCIKDKDETISILPHSLAGELIIYAEEHLAL